MNWSLLLVKLQVSIEYRKRCQFWSGQVGGGPLPRGNSSSSLYKPKQRRISPVSFIKKFILSISIREKEMPCLSIEEIAFFAFDWPRLRPAILAIWTRLIPYSINRSLNSKMFVIMPRSHLVRLTADRPFYKKNAPQILLWSGRRSEYLVLCSRWPSRALLYIFLGLRQWSKYISSHSCQHVFSWASCKVCKCYVPPCN